MRYDSLATNETIPRLRPRPDSEFALDLEKRKFRFKYVQSVEIADHSARHENGGADEISVTGLSGLLADDQHVLDSEVLAVAAALVHAARHQNGGDDEISLAGLSGEPADTVNKSLFDAQTILAAVTDNTPAALAVAEQRLVGRITSGNIAALTVAQAKTLLGAGAASGLATLDASTKVVEQPASITDHLEGTPTEDLATKAPTSEWAYDHAALAAAHGATGAVVGTTNIQVLTNKTLTSPTINGTIATTGLTLPAVTLGGAMTVTGQVFNTGAGSARINTTGNGTGLIIVDTNDLAYGALLMLNQISASPAANDRVGIIYGYGRDSGGNATLYTEIDLRITSPTDGAETGNMLIKLISGGAQNEALRLADTGVLDVDASSGLGAATVGLFDKYDDAIILKEGISNRQLEALEKVGVMTRKDSGSGWMLNIQAMLYLLAGGIYQNRARIDQLSNRLLIGRN